MTVIERIDISPVSLEDQKITDQNEQFLEIRDTSICYCCRFYADEPINPDDKELGWKNVFNRFRTVASKDKIAGIELTYLPNAKKWGVFIMVTGFTNDMKVFFRKEDDANSVFDKLHNWLYE
jgi:hypothetical protein